MTNAQYENQTFKCDYRVIIHICHYIFIFCYFALIITTAITASPTATLSPASVFSPSFFTTSLPYSYHYLLFSPPSTSFLLLLTLSYSPLYNLTVKSLRYPLLPFPQPDTSLSLALCLPPDHAYRSLNVFPLCHALFGWLPHNILDDYCNIATIQPLIDIPPPPPRSLFSLQRRPHVTLDHHNSSFTLEPLSFL